MTKQKQQPKNWRKENVPKLRFPEFFDEWENQKFVDVFETIATKNYQIKNSEILKKGDYKVVDQGMNLVAGYSNSKNKVFSNIPVIIFGDHTTILKYINFNFIIGADGTKVLTTKDKRNNLKFLYYLIQLNPIKPEGYKRHYSILKNKFFLTPFNSEQKKIAGFLTAVDQWIENLHKQKESFESYKKGLMQKIFSQQIRFKDDNGKDFSDWEEKKLGEVFSAEKGTGLSKEKISVDGKNECILYGELYTTYTEIVFGIKSKTNNTEGSKSKIGDLLIPCSTTTIGIDLANVTALNREGVLLGGDITILREKKKIDNIFYAYYLSNYKKNDIARYAQGVTIIHLYYNHFKNMVIDLPSFKEQKKIAEFLTSVDKLIELKQQQITQAEIWKKGLMQGLFV